ncbi:MAG: DUF2079 domain-containing protein [Oligoflexia bacterium]|nr:DUF2079 domain-containing protein [Oligoflexia bacterium]
MQSKNVTWLIRLFALGLPLIMLLHNLKAYFHHCFNNNDLALYSEAILRMGNHFELNPFLSVRGVFILNDHFEPILWPVALVVRLLGNSVITVMVVEILFLVVAMEFWWWMHCRAFRSSEYYERTFDAEEKKLVKLVSFLLVAVAIFFCKGLLLALTFPIHPSTWSILPIAFLVYFTLKEKLLGIVVSAAALCLFREEFPFAVLALSFYFLFFGKNFRTFLAVGAVGAAFTIFDFGLRPYLVGPIVGYGNGLVTSLLNDPLAAIAEGFSKFNFSLFSIYYPFILPLLFCVRKNFLPILFFLSPLLLIRFLSGQHNFHYAAPIVATLISYIIMSGLPVRAGAALVKREKVAPIIIIALLLFVGSGISVYTKAFKLFIGGKQSKCVVSSEKSLASDRLFEAVEKEKIVSMAASGGVTPRLLDPTIKLYHLGGYIPDEGVKHLLLEKSFPANVWPLQESDLILIQKACSPYVKRVIIDDEFYYFAEGDFPFSALHLVQGGKK